eukprot:gnl/MRDRNA2_/MRDRNA2_77254_c0_seq1.p1 gnl/MRDRNA2_/MRDRNA2_77254_c0~~gnl/MRDRNA2_/MRDRNA2_77254_c0_seq1.p1  ORF type:complete len:496 (+),score=114.11 gnl/MRDRNA2_/MRDRNA2_77254_c0_seq1:88-1488(+)
MADASSARETHRRSSGQTTHNWAQIAGAVDQQREPIALAVDRERFKSGNLINENTRSILREIDDDPDSMQIVEEVAKMESDWHDKGKRATFDQIKHWAELFVMFDADESGGLDSSEIGSLMRSLQAPFRTVPQSRIEDMFDELEEDEDQMDLKKYLMTMLRVIHYPQHWASMREPRETTYAPTKTKAVEVLREAILSVHKELESPADEFITRCHKDAKKDQPKDREYFERAANMLVDLQEKLLFERSLVEDFQLDLGVFGGQLEQTSLARQRQLKHQLAMQEQYEKQNADLRAELERTKREIEEVREQQKDCLSAIDAEQRRLIGEREMLQQSLERSMSQVRVDQLSAADFMARMLKNDERISALEQYVPRHEALTKAYEETEQENTMLLQVLQEAHEFFESGHQTKVQNLEKSRQAGAELEAALRRVRDTHALVARDAAIRVEDALPFHKVARGQDALARRLGAL